MPVPSTIDERQREFVKFKAAYWCEPVWRIEFGGFPFQSRSGVSRWKDETSARKAFRSHLHASGPFEYIRAGLIGTCVPHECYNAKELPVLIKLLEKENLLFFIDTTVGLRYP